MLPLFIINFVYIDIVQWHIIHMISILRKQKKSDIKPEVHLS